MQNLSRRIHTVSADYDSNYSFQLNGRGMSAFPGLKQFLRVNGPTKFSRRKFKGATSIVLKPDLNHWWSDNNLSPVPVFDGQVAGHDIEVCGSKAKTYLGVTKNSKRVTVWYKKVVA